MLLSAVYFIEKMKKLLTNFKKYATIIAILKKGGPKLEMDGDSSGDANCIPLNRIMVSERHIYTAMDRVGAPFCVVFRRKRNEKIIS